jgi:hypothetical protein
MENTEKPLVTNAADESQVKAAVQKLRRRRQQELNDVRAVLSTREGRRMFWRYLDFCGVYRTSFQGQFQTFFNEGQRNVGLVLLSDVNEADPKAHALMLEEDRKEKNV